MDRDEEVGLMLVGNRSARFQRDERIVVAGVNDICAQSRLQQLPQAQRHIEYQVFLQQAVRPNGSGVMPTMSGVDHDPSDLQSERANQAAVAIGGRRSFVDGWRFSRRCRAVFLLPRDFLSGGDTVTAVGAAVGLVLALLLLAPGLGKSSSSSASSCLARATVVAEFARWSASSILSRHRLG